MIRISSVGKNNAEYSALFTHFTKMVKLNLSEYVITPPKVMNIQKQKQEEGRLLKNSSLTGSFLVALDRCGKSCTSEEFTKILINNINHSRDITFLIGGAYGMDEALLKEVDMKLSLSSMTMPHMIAKLILVEQIYRAETIMNNHPYHK